MEHTYTYKIGDDEIAFTDEELEKTRNYMYMTSGVKCYNKDGNLIKNPFDEFPQSYTVDVTKDFHAFLYDLCCEYVMCFPEPSVNEMAALLAKEPHTARYECDNIPWSDNEYHYCGTFIRVDP